MSTRKRAKQNLFKMNWLLLRLLVISRRTRKQARLSRSGFVLPTVVMVSLVVLLLTTAIMLQSFDRAEKASKFRAEQVVLNAATPALDRARAKLDALFTDTTLPQTTPSDLDLYSALTSSRYTFGDETLLKLVYDIDQNGTIQGNTATLENNETLTTAWKFPVDTDNNGKFDSYSLYGIYFRSPSRNTDGTFKRARNPLEARIPPMSGGTQSSYCKNVTDTSVGLVGDSWYKSGAKLTKSFFVYTATVPITNTNPPTGYETFKGNKGFYALELQQDRSRIPLSNNAVVFQDDLELTPGSTFLLNGRISTNANLLIGGHSGAAVRLYQVSSVYSCFYEQENSKITVAGNVGTGNVADDSDQTAVTIDLFNGAGNTPGTATININNRSTTSLGGSQVAYNDAAYNKRIALMRQTALSYSTTTPTQTSVSSISQYPAEVKNAFKAKLNAPGGNSLNPQDVLAEEIEIYLKNRTRRVPYAEVSAFDGTDALGTYDADGDGIDTNVFTLGLEPPAAWSEMTNTNPLTLTTASLAQTQPDKQRQDGKETHLGDRVYVGNNLPLYWKNDNGEYVTGADAKNFLGSNINWTSPNTEPRYRTTQIAPLPDVGISERNGWWEDAAAQQPAATSPNVGGLRLITGAGIYVTDNRSASFLPQPTLDVGVSPPLFTTSSITIGDNNIVVWPDTMPMTGGAGETRKGDLQMRATAVYHYKDSYTDLAANYIYRTPTACVSSYYDPTNATTAKNSLNTWSDNYAPNGRSNNGIVYPAPYTTDNDRVTAVFAYRAQLNKQARLVFSDGRIVNQPLRDALKKVDAGGTRSLKDNSAIDTAICAIRILGDTTFLPSTTPIIPHGAIKEASFLDAREVKAIEGHSSDPTDYDLDLEQRQPLEIRVTDIDLRQLAKKTIGGTAQQEYFLPNSGIIYASRDDALLDSSDISAEKELLSSTDFRLDPTRRPNGIRLINGSNLARVITYREEEKGLILVSNLPVYIKADSNNGFNLHQKPGTNTAVEEFTDSLNSDWSNFYTRGDKYPSTDIQDNNFACRSGQLGCATGSQAGDQWRPATIISDAITLLSKSFTDGFRNQADYDLNNNAGSAATKDRKRNGFWDNSFVPSALWWDIHNTDNAYPYETASTHVGSYLTNGVTPIQRRVNFSEYVMEICRKIPVSQCQPSDWVVGYDFNGNGSLEDSVSFDVDGDGAVNSNDTEKIIRANQLGYALLSAGKSAGDDILSNTEIQWSTPYTTGANNKSPLNRLGAGTTSSSTLAKVDERYARRVAFARNQFNALVLTPIGSGDNAANVAKPLGVGCPLDKTGTVPENNGCQYPDSSSWTAGTHYGNTVRDDGTNVHNALWFRTTNNITGEPGASADISYASNRPLYYLPPELGGEKLFLPETPEIPNVKTLNGSGANDPSDYTMCLTSGSAGQSQEYLVTSLSGSCPIDLNTQVEQLLELTPLETLTGNNQILTASTTSNINIYKLPNGNPDINFGTTITLKGNANSIFIFQGGSSIQFGKNEPGAGIKIAVNGVDPNNVFWISNGSLTIEDATAAQPHQLVGNFIGKTSLKIGANTNVLGGRFLNYNTISGGIPTSSKIYAVTTVSQPSLVPVLQIHSPEGAPANNNSFPTDGNLENEWLQRVAADTTINAVLVSGNNPSRAAEESAGLHNFVRLLERWDDRKLNVKGSFIQFKRSAYATAPFATVLTDTASATATATNNLSLFDYPNNTYKVANGTPTGTLPYYRRGTGQWSFDVGLLSQSPDLFAQKFTQQFAAPPQEYFREVERDDRWIQTLLCAAQGTGTSYTYAIDASEQPITGCPSLDLYKDY